MENSREKKRLGRVDAFFIVFTSAIWAVAAYKVATVGIPTGWLGRFNLAMCFLLIPVLIRRTTKR